MSNDVDKFYRVIAELDRLLIPGTGDGFWSARSIFSEMDRSFLNGWSICHLKEILDEKELLVFRDRNTLTINVTKGYAISVALIDRPPGALYLFPQHYVARNVGRVPLKVRRYNPDRPVKNDIYDPDVRLELREEFELKPGEALERNGHADVLDWESGGPTGHVLRLHSESLGSYEWSFDRETCKPTGVTVLDGLSSQVTTAMQMLAILGAPMDREFVEVGLTSPHFHVRWETVKMLGQAAPELVGAAVERLKDDPHPAIRRAVERTRAMNAASRGVES
ncbi:MAG TPA: HEAT repeat domain-containing protein [Rhizomicrobium sp.]|nr:HEAT repeat domain-containing protein [Rhizomicrobium sp.]